MEPVPDKIAEDELNSLFIINGTSILTVWLSLILIYVISSIVPYFLNSFKVKYYEDFPTNRKFRMKLKIYFLSFKIFITQICCVIISEFFYSGILRAHMATSYDYSFTTIL